MEIDGKLLHPQNVYSSIREIPLGSVTELKLLQPLNTDLPSLVTLLGIVMEVKPLHLNAPSSMLVTLLGIETEVKLLQLLIA